MSWHRPWEFPERLQVDKWIKGLLRRPLFDFLARSSLASLTLRSAKPSGSRGSYIVIFWLVRALTNLTLAGEPVAGGRVEVTALVDLGLR